MTYWLKSLPPQAIIKLLVSLFTHGINISVILHVSRRFKNKVAVTSDNETLTYEQLFTQTETLAHHLNQNYKLQQSQKVAILCHNHLSFVKALFACSRLGANIYLLHTKMSKEQLQTIINEHQFDFIIYDFSFHSILNRQHKKLVAYHDTFPSVDRLSKLSTKKSHLRRTANVKLHVFTAGTTGKPKVVAHTPSLFTYFPPFIAMLRRLKLVRYETAYIATPMYHSYGLAILLLFLALGKKVVISETFRAEKMKEMIDTHNVEVMTAVPFMIEQMVRGETSKLSSLKCIVSGSAELRAKLVEKVFQRLGPVLYNIYGTTEGGLVTIATPKELQMDARTIGRKILGVPLHVRNQNNKHVRNGEVGEFYLYRNRNWIETGDVGYKNEKGLYFLCGRKDDLVISGGVNIYPLQIEQVLTSHKEIREAVVIGVKDDVYGQRLKAFIQIEEQSQLNEKKLKDWLQHKVSTYEIPKEIEFVDIIPYTGVGKIDKKIMKQKEKA